MPKTQTTSPTTARLQCNLPRWSALWTQQCSRPRPHRHQSGGIALHEGSTRRRHAARRLRVVQNPHHHLHGEHQGYGGPGRSACERQKPGNRTQGRPTFGTKLSQHTHPHRISGTKLSQHTPSHRMAVQSSPSTSRTAPLPVQNSPCSPEMAQYGAFSTCRESFIPFSPPRSQAGRVMYRSHHQEAEQGKLCTEREAEIKRANTTTLLAPQV